MPQSDGDVIRYGIVGAGMMGREHIGNILAFDDAVVTALVDPHESSINEAEALLPEPAAILDSHRDLAGSGLCDAVVVATPNHTHHDVLMDLLPTSLHLLVEKPLCTTVADCEKVVAAARGRDAVTWMGLEYRYMPPVARLLELIDGGAVGDVRMVAIREHRFPFLDKVGAWNRFNRNTGGTMVEKCCHFFDLMNRMIGTLPVSVYASGSQDVNHLDEEIDGERPDVLDNAFVVVEYEGGRRSMLDLCMFAEATHNQEEISVVGDTGKVEALIPEGVVRVGRRGEHWIGGVDSAVVDDPTILYEGQHHGSSFVEHRRFLAAIREGTDPEVDLAAGLAAVAVGQAAQLSIDERRPVDLSEIVDLGR